MALRLTDFTDAPPIETQRLVLRPHRLDDLAGTTEMWADREVVRHITGEPSSPEMSWSRLLRYAGHWALLGFGYWAVSAKEDGRFIGEVGFARHERAIEPPLGTCPEAGWVLKACEHGRGFASEAMACLVEWADRNLPVAETVCIVSPDHPASIRVADKIGYERTAEGRYRGDPVLVMSRSRS